MNKEKQFLVESLGKELIEMLMSDYGWDLQKSMDVLYSSETFAKLEDERSGLYYQGAIYVYSFLKQEIKKITNNKNPITPVVTKDSINSL